MTARDGDLRAIFRRKLPHFDWTSVESGGTGRGIPDSEYCHEGATGWVEFKQTDGWAVKIRAEQVGWIMRRWRHGGRVWVAVRRRSDELWVVPGDAAVQLKGHGLRAVPSEHWSGGPGSWDWERVAYLLAPPRAA
jgi:hypothetical protein